MKFAVQTLERLNKVLRMHLMSPKFRYMDRFSD